MDDDERRFGDPREYEEELDVCASCGCLPDSPFGCESCGTTMCESCWDDGEMMCPSCVIEEATQ